MRRMSLCASAMIAATLLLAPTVTAKACTTLQLTQLAGVAATFSDSPDCAGSALDSSINTPEAICGGGCMELVYQLQPDAPDCEYMNTNLGETMSQLVRWCDATSISGSQSRLGSQSSLGSLPGWSSTAGSAGEDANFTAINATDAVPVCSIENVTLIDSIEIEASKTADCLGSAGAANGATNKADYCAEDACIAFITDLVPRLPNCSYGGYNLKQAIADVLALCDDPTVEWPFTPTATKTTLLPTVTNQTPTATPSQDSQEREARVTPAESSATSALKLEVSFVTASALAVIVVSAMISL